MEKFKLYVLNNKKTLIILGSILLTIMCFLGYYFYFQVFDEKEIIIDETVFNEFENDFVVDEETIEQDVSGEELEEVQEEEKVEYIFVDIKGYVNKPGVYKVSKNDDKRIYDLIALAGGLKKDADTSIINMSTKLKDEMVVIIYSKNEIQNFVKTKEELNNKVEICEREEVKNDACICENDINNNYNNNGSKEESNGNVSADEPSVGDNKVNINTASKELLMTLPNIGESKAQAIIGYRDEVGLFEKIEDIKNVSGIGDSVFEKIKNLITIE